MVYNRPEVWILPSIEDEKYRKRQLMLKGQEPNAVEAIFSDEVAKGLVIKHIKQDKGNRKYFEAQEKRAEEIKKNPVPMEAHEQSLKDIQELKKRFPNA